VNIASPKDEKDKDILKPNAGQRSKSEQDHKSRASNNTSTKGNDQEEDGIEVC